MSPSKHVLALIICEAFKISLGLFQPSRPPTHTHGSDAAAAAAIAAAAAAAQIVPANARKLERGELKVVQPVLIQANQEAAPKSSGKGQDRSPTYSAPAAGAS